MGRGEATFGIFLRAIGLDLRHDHFGYSFCKCLANLCDREIARRFIDEGPTVADSLVSLAIDEFPALFVAAAAAQGTTRFTGIGELRVKESDRIAAMADGMRRLGIQVDESPDGAVVHGGRFTGGDVNSFHDHRVAMSLAMAATIAEDEVRIRDVDNVDTSFPGFRECVAGIGADVRVA